MHGSLQFFAFGLLSLLLLFECCGALLAHIVRLGFIVFYVWVAQLIYVPCIFFALGLLSLRAILVRLGSLLEASLSLLETILVSGS